MVSETDVSTLVGQVVRATARLNGQRAKGQDLRVIHGIARGLRRTLACALQGLDLRDVGREGFTAVANAQGWPLVRHGSRVVGGLGSYLQHLLKEAGVELAPRQVILLEPVLVQEIVEEALSRNALYEAVLRQEKAMLRATSVAAASLEEGKHAPGQEDEPAKASGEAA